MLGNTKKVPRRGSDSYLDSFDFVAVPSRHGKYHFGSPFAFSVYFRKQIPFRDKAPGGAT